MKLLVIDIQKGITNHQLYGFESFITNVKSLIKTARANGIEVIYIQHDDGEGCLLHEGNEAFAIYQECEPL